MPALCSQGPTAAGLLADGPGVRSTPCVRSGPEQLLAAALDHCVHFHITHSFTDTAAGESAGSSVAFISSFFSLAMGQPVSQKVPCGTVPRKSLEARKSLVAPYQESPLRHESPL